VLPGRGALCVQAEPNPFWKPYGAMMLGSGATADDIVRTLVRPDPKREERQLLALGSDGTFAGFTGRNCPPQAAHIAGDGFIVGGNFLASLEVLQAMARVAGLKTMPVRSRLSCALDLAEGAGGDLRGSRSACIVVNRDVHAVDNSDYPLADLSGGGNVFAAITQPNSYRAPGGLL
ncbi:DUF1028 domain-containing protein, partial [Reyranella soli]|uniref:DUF1028 domain-containing protein n=1 Tax=Reyranella soli TaxID=1230389 RepID=UPI0011BED4AA